MKNHLFKGGKDIMKAGETSLQKLMNSALQFIVPIYQRTYSWEFKQCKQLWDDIIQITQNEDNKDHFIGSIVYIDLGTPKGTTQQLLLIDGQQRLTTLSLLLCALARYIDDIGLDDDKGQGNKVNSNKIRNYFLLNNEEEGLDRYKMILTEQDKDTFIKILEGAENNVMNPSERMLENFNFFQKIISDSKKEVETIYYGIQHLVLVSVVLDKTQDKPQLIFESMNSTGKDLSQADLIRNYILMGEPSQQQESLYRNYWRPMEQGFGEKGYNDYFDWFMRDFLTSQDKSGRICKIKEVYESFKKYLERCESNEKSLVNVYTYAQYYISIHLGKEKDTELKSLWSELRTLDVSVSYPFLMRVYDDYKKSIISKDEFIIIVRTTINYVVRRSICDIPTNSLNKTFATFYSKIKPQNYVKSILAEYVIKDSYRAFPTDDEFAEKFTTKAIYNMRIKNYILECLENHDHKEPISIIRDGYTIEHIMPQNQDLNSEWKNMLGNDWKEVQKNYLHTIGNLTLTGYNSELNDSPFNKKQTMKGGFRDSHLRLNDGIRDLENWNMEEIKKRAKVIANKALEIWTYPKIAEDDISEHLEKDKIKNTYTSIDHYPVMSSEIREIYYKLDRKIMSLDSGISKEYKKRYIAYKVDTNFVTIKVSKNELTIGLNIPFYVINDPNKMCRDTTNTGNFANNDVLFKVSTDTDLDYVIDLSMQALIYQIEN